MNGEKENKEQLRKRIKNLLNKYPVSLLEEKTRCIQSRFSSLPEYKNSSFVMFYVSTGKEVSTLDVIKTALAENKKVAVPLILKSRNIMIPCEIKNLTDLKPGPFGILQPAKDKVQPIPRAQELDLIDLIIVPGVAFDRKGNRVGKGKGFYDKFLKLINETIPKIVLAFSCQIVEQIPTAEHDISVDKIVTEDEVIECKARHKGTEGQR